MSVGEVFQRDRQVIPRWHTYPMARWLGVTSSLGSGRKKQDSDIDYLAKVYDWKEKGRISHAGDLVGSALVLNNFEDQVAIDAAKFILQNSKKATESLIEITENFLRLVKNDPFPLPDIILPEDLRKYHIAISNIKKRIREYPRNPILWMDLGYYYSTLGQSKPAEDAVMVALSLNKDNRYLIRSSARFFLHNESPDIALSFLRRSEVGLHDPWVLAAEIAISDNLKTTSKRLKIAKEMVADQNISKFHLSELASALGTIELKSGAQKKGKKLLSLALQDPTENVFAQAIFLSTLFGGSNNFPTPEKIPHSFEAQTRVKFQAGDFQSSLDSAKKWFAYQPFSSRPAMAASYVASVALGHFEEAAKIAKMGLLASPRDFILKNNLAFSLASLGKGSDARKVLESVSESQLKQSEKGTLAATMGVVEFREGNVEEGKKSYKKAIELFRRENNFRSETLAKFFWAREEKIIKSSEANALIEEAQDMAKKHSLGELPFQLIANE